MKFFNVMPFKTSTFTNLSWTLIPSVIWSFTFYAPVFCIDTLLLPFLERFFSRRARVAIRSIWLCVFVISLLFTWNIAPRSYLFYISEALAFSPVRIVLGFAIGLLVIVSLAVLIPKRAERSLSVRLAAIGMILLGLKLVISGGVGAVGDLNRAIKSPILIVANMSVASLVQKSGNILLDGHSTNSFYSFVRNYPQLPYKVVLMVVESWGEKAESFAKMQDELSKENIKIVQAGFTQFRGGTLQGEFRELCSIYTDLDTEMTKNSHPFDCAPAYFKNKGYATIGLHGNKGAFYARRILWKRFGFSDAAFEEELNSLNHCEGAFFGICDIDLISRGVAILANEKPTFLYMLTLSSHEPLDVLLLDSKSVFFGTVPADVPAQALARQAVSKLIADLRAVPNGACTLAYIVGDHQPSSVAGSDNLERGSVPYMVVSFNC